MSINAQNRSKPRELVPAGNHIARCVSMIEIGTVLEQGFGGKMQKLTKVMIGWELPEETRVFDESKGEQPMMISKEYTLSMNEKSNLRADLTSWRGKGFTEEEAKSFDITVLLGIPCMLNISHVPKQKNPSELREKITLAAIPKGFKAPQQVNPLTILSYDEFDDRVFEKLPDFLKDKIKSSEEYKILNSPKAQKHIDPEINSEEDNDLPF